MPGQTRLIISLARRARLFLVIHMFLFLCVSVCVCGDYNCSKEHPELWLSLFSIGSSSDLQRKALYSALLALSVFKAAGLISPYVPPTFRSTLNADDYHYSQQRHLSHYNKFGFFISIIIFPRALSLLWLRYLQLSRFELTLLCAKDLFVLPCSLSCVGQMCLRLQRPLFRRLI